MPEMIGATARSPAQSIHLRLASTCGVTVSRSGMLGHRFPRDVRPVGQDRPELLREIGSRRAENVGLSEPVEGHPQVATPGLTRPEFLLAEYLK